MNINENIIFKIIFKYIYKNVSIKKIQNAMLENYRDLLFNNLKRWGTKMNFANKL
jgi:hypothetical protein